MSINLTYLAAGLCGKCGEEPPLEGRQLGAECTKRRSRRQKTHAERTGKAPPHAWAPKQQCACGAPRRPGGNHCAGCHAASQARYRKRKAAELEQLRNLAATPPRQQPPRMTTRPSLVGAQAIEPPKTKVVISAGSSGPQPLPREAKIERQACESLVMF